MEDTKYTELTAKYLSGNIRPEERRELMAWVDAHVDNRAYFDDMTKIWSSASAYDQSFETDVNAAWNKVEAALDELSSSTEGKTAEPHTARRRSLAVRLLRVAAVLLPLLAFGYWWLSSTSPKVETVLVSASNEVKEITLPDGSNIWLNVDSRLQYELPFDERKVTLEGEAFFAIESDSLHPFEIYAGPTVTRVLGTSFNVRAYPQESRIAVTVTSGIVQLQEISGEESIELEAGEAAAYLKDANSVVSTGSLGSNAVAWKNRVIDANGITLEELVNTLNNYFKVNIEVEDPEALKCDVVLPDLQDPSLDKALELLTGFMHLEIDTTDTARILLTGPGC